MRHFNKGLCLVQLKKYSEAIDVFDHALEIDPAYTPALYLPRYIPFCSSNDIQMQ